jgi:hypothetical protein
VLSFVERPGLPHASETTKQNEDKQRHQPETAAIRIRHDNACPIYITAMTLINVVIVESHQHALEHVHSAIRKGKYFGQDWSMIHFDAHPDLACPRLPAMACFVPRQPTASSQVNEAEEKNLYEWLDLSSSGIAEWIIPLVMAANLRVVEWIKPSFSTQLPNGFHRYKIGAHEDSMSPRSEKINSFLDLPPTAEIKTDLSLPYYLDDDSVVPSEQLLLAQTLELHVTELSHETTAFSSNQSSEGFWSLDICLDYFSCLNPFMSDIDRVDPAVTDALLNLMGKAVRYTQATKSPSHLKDVVRDILSSKTSCIDSSGSHEQLSSFYETKEEATALIDNLERLIEENASVLPLVLKAIPHWSMPHAVSSADESQILESLSRVERAIQGRSGIPFVVTICRSSDDEFTPPSVVESLQEKVLLMLHRVFCGTENCCDACRLRIVRDYGEWEGSTL